MTVLKRDKSVCLSRLNRTKDGMLRTSEACRIQVPERWMNVGLGSITATTTVFGFFPIIFEDNTYAVMSVCALVDVLPSRTTKISVNDEMYYEFYFDANTNILRSMNVVRQDTLTFNIIDELIMKGKVPWWVTVDDLCGIFDTAEKYAGSSIGNVPQTIEFLVGIITRRLAQRENAIRHTAKTEEDLELSQIEFIPLKSVLHAVNNTVSKLSGAYFSQGVISAIVFPTTRIGKVERILRL